MLKRAPRSTAAIRNGLPPFTIGGFLFSAEGVTPQGVPNWDEYLGAFEFAKRAHRSSGFWLADLLRYGESRRDWVDKLSQAVDATGLSEKRLANIRAVGAIETSRRRDDVEFGLHEELVGYEPQEQTEWLNRCATEGWTRRELRLELKAAKRRRIIDTQAELAGTYRVILADPPWLYGDRPPSGSGAQQHYPGMTIDALCKLPVAAHARRDAVLFLWTTAPMLYAYPGPREVIDAWGFTPKTGMVWDKVLHGFGHYVEVKHEHVIIATRGSCTPDRPTPMIPSILVERRSDTHSQKPEGMRRIIERLYDGPYLELFAREKVPNWTCWGNDARLWPMQVTEEAQAV
jgi:N6-adenosine-specific RNA methylase IME4